jgi:asparagine synthase (glutamine-hydrolysing)
VRALDKIERRDELFLGSVAFTEVEKSKLLDPRFPPPGQSSQALLNDIVRPLDEAWPRADIAAHVSYVDIKIRLAELLLMRIDKVTMSVGVEAREPFLDYRLVEYLMRLPLQTKLNDWNPKHLLKQAMSGLLPDTIIGRPKKAFAAPINAWLNAGLIGFVRHRILHSKIRSRDFLNYDVVTQMLDDHTRGKKDYGVQIWTLLNLCGWYDHWIDGHWQPASASPRLDEKSAAAPAAVRGERP